MVTLIHIQNTYLITFITSETSFILQYFDNGAEESIRVMATCLDHFDIYEDDLESTDLDPTIGSLFRNLMHKHHFSTAFCGLMRDRLVTENFLNNLSTALKLSAHEKVGFGLNLLDSENYEIRTEGRKFCMSQCKALCNIQDKLDTLEADVQDVLTFLEQSDVFSKLVDSFKAMILQVWLNANSRLILADKVDDTVLLSHINFHINVPKEIPTEMRASFFAKMLGTTLIFRFLCYWNRLSYRCGELRAEGLQLRADVAFSILMSCYRLACQAPYPLAVVLGNVWENEESQLLFLKHAVSSPPEVFTFAHCKKQLECVDHEFQADHASQPWLCLDLLEVLCQLAEKGHTTSVWSMMEFPLKHCPEALLLGMAHVITPYNLLPHEVAKSVLPMLLEDSSKRGILLRVWGVNPLLVSRALNHVLVLDLENMNKVVDLFQELEILSSVLDLVPMHLGIKLASLASRKEFVDLVEWLGTNLSAYEDDFYECLRFLKEVEDNAGDIWNIYKEIAPTFAKALKLQTDVLASKELSKKMESLYVTCMQDSSKKENIDDLDSSTSESHADHITTKMQESSSRSTGSTSRQGPVTSAMFGGAISIDTLLAAFEDRETPVEIPPSETQDKIMFLINNLSPANIEEKAKEFTGILAERYYPWFAQYLVMRRVGIEANFHSQYINFLEKTRSKQLNNEIVQATYENCKVLLRSDLIKSSVEERKLLKNLGSWLGKLTIGRNQPLLAKHIDPKSLIAEAYEKGLMIGVIPFISKILELCQRSIAYQLPNPWTMAILGLLVEVYSMPNLKANLTFEIEVLFKNLHVDIKEVKPTTLLEDKSRVTEGNPDFSQPKIVEVAGPSYQPTVTASNIPDFRSVLKTHVLGLLPMAMNKAIEELVSTVVERSVSIASETAIELVLKEYINDPDEIYIDNVSSLMVAYLAGSLSSVTCKEPLRVLTSTHLRNSTRGLNVPTEFLEDAMKCVIDENLHFGWASIEKNATEKGLSTVKREITRQLSIRKKQKEDSESVINKTVEPSYSTTDVALSQVTYGSEPDPLQGQVSVFLAEWYQMRAHSGVSDAVCAPYVQELYQTVLSISDDMSNRFFGILLELVISHYRPFEINPSPMQFHQQDTSSFLAIDIYTDVVFSVLKFYPDNEKSTKYSLLLKVLTVMVGFITTDANEKKSTFNPKPYFRIFNNILNRLNTVNSVILDADFHVLAGLAQSFHALQPAKVPEFSFAWLELVTLTDFMPKLLNQDNHQGWPYFKCLVIDVLRFMEPMLRSGEVTEPVLVHYNYTRRMLLVLSHDFPEFICYYRSSLYDIIPPHCIELRNIILSTVPHNMRTPI
ncbi:putative CCR4-Not complex component, Not1, MIF4G-like domain superfamily [Helianthus anomalus]